jgi:phage baseplate assembly protein W
MLIDFYMRNEYEPGYNSNSLFVVDPYEILLNKIKMILFTRPGEVFGNPDFGIDLESYVFETRINEQQIVSNI